MMQFMSTYIYIGEKDHLIIFWIKSCFRAFGRKTDFRNVEENHT